MQTINGYIRNYLSGILSGFVISLIFFSYNLYTSYKARQEKDKLVNEIKELNSSIKDLQTKVNNLNNNQSNLIQNQDILPKNFSFFE